MKNTNIRKADFQDWRNFLLNGEVSALKNAWQQHLNDPLFKDYRNNLINWSATVSDFLKSKFNGTLSLEAESVRYAKIISTAGEYIDLFEQIWQPYSAVRINYRPRLQAVPYFVGRKSQLIWLEEYCKTFNIVIIEGLGGIGKSQLVAQFMSTRLDDRTREKIVWFEGSDSSSFSELIEICGLRSHSDLLTVSFRELHAKMEEEAYWMVWDSFEQIKDNREFIAFLERYNNKFEHARLIITTRSGEAFRRLLNSYRFLKLDYLSNEDSLELVKRMTDINLDGQDIASIESELKLLANHLKGYPLAIKLAVPRLRFDKATDILRGMDKLGEFQIIDKLLNEIIAQPDFSPRLLHVLEQLSVFNEQFFEEEAGYLTTSPDIHQDLLILVNNNLLNFQRVTGAYDFHPVIRERIYARLTDPRFFHGRLADYIERDNRELTLSEEISLFFHRQKADQAELLFQRLLHRDEFFFRKGNWGLLRQYLDFLPSSAVTLYWKGRLEGVSKKKLEAIAFLNQALGDLKGFDKKYYPKILREIAFLTYAGNDEGAHEKAVAYLYEIIAIYEREGNISELSDAKGQLANALRMKNTLDQEVISLFQEAVDLAELSKDDRIQGIIYGNWGNAYQDIKDFEKAKERFEKSKIYFERADYPYGHCVALNQLANVYHALSQFDLAKTAFEEELKISKEIGYIEGTSNALEGLGRVLQSVGRYKEANQRSEQHLKIVETVGTNQEIANAYWNIGGSYLLSENYSRAKACFEKQLALIDKSDVLTGDHFYIYWNLGQVEIGTSRFKTAIPNFLKQLEIAREQKRTLEDMIAALHNVGRAYQQCFEADQAHRFFQEALELAEGEENYLQVQYCLEQFGHFYLALNELENAKNYYLKQKSCIENNKLEDYRINPLFFLTDLNKQSSNYKEARSWLEEAFNYLQERPEDQQWIHYYLREITVDYHLNCDKELVDKTVKQIYTYIELVSEPLQKLPLLEQAGASFQDIDYFEQAYQIYQEIERLSKDIENPGWQLKSYWGLGVSCVRKKAYQEAIQYFESQYILASEIGHKTSCDNALGNKAQALFILGDIVAGKRILDDLWEHNENLILDIELQFYAYAHIPTLRLVARRRIEKLLEQGVRSIGWDFSSNIEVAINNGHKEPDDLFFLAKSITTR